MKKRTPSQHIHQWTENLFTRNWLYKLIALAVAVAIWTTTLQAHKDALLNRTMEIEFLLKPNLAITNFIERRVHVQVAGPTPALKKFSQSSQVISVNLANAAAGPVSFTLQPGDISLPPGLRLVEVQPSHFELEVKEVKKP